MKNTFGKFSDSAIVDFSEEMAERFDFTRCQRPNGTFYGTGGTCRKGAEVGPKEMAALKKAAKGGNERAQKALDKVEGKSSKPVAKEEAPKKAAPPAADKMSTDDLNIVAIGGEVGLADGSVYRKGDDGNFYRVKEDGSLSTLDMKPRELATEAKYKASLVKEEPKKGEESEPKPAAKPVAKKEGEETPYKKGEFAPEKDAWKDDAKLEAAAAAWRERQGLADETSVHDLVHMGVHSFTGRTSEDLAKMQGQKGVTTTEEILVNLVSFHAAGGGGKIDNRSSLLAEAKEMRNFFEEGEGLTPLQIQRWDRDSRRAVAIFERMSKQEGFDDFISQMEGYAG